MDDNINLLTEDEKDAINYAAKAYGAMKKVIMANDDGTGVAEADLQEIVTAVHKIQQMAMSQAAARAYPSEYRLLGGKIHDHIITEITIEPTNQLPTWGQDET